MSASEDHDQPRVYSRRNFLGKFSVGLATIAAAGFLAKSFLFTGGSEKVGPEEEFPGEDSIFHPQTDPRLDPRRKTQA